MIRLIRLIRVSRGIQSTPSRSTALVCSLLAIGGALPAVAASPRVFQVQSASDFARGKLDGVRLDPLGAVELGAPLAKVAAIDEAYVLAVARHPKGWVVGTGNAGKVILLDEKGQAELLFTAPEPEIFAVAVDAQGTIWAASSPHGKLYRLKGNGEADAVFAPDEAYLWAIAPEASGSLLVATGTRGRLYRVQGDGKSELLLDRVDTHVRALLPRPDGSVIVGTAGQGVLLERRADGSVRTLYDPPQPEVASIVAGPEGDWFAAAVASEASWVEPGARIVASAGGEVAGEGSQAVVTVTAEGDAAAAAATPPPRLASGKGPRSEILHGSRGGRDGRDGQIDRVDRVEELVEETAFALLWHAGRLWVATGLEGRLYSLVEGRLVLERDLEERQLVAFAPGETPALLTTNGGALYRLTEGRERTGTVTSAALDASLLARWGSLHWQGSVPSGARLRFAVRGGETAEPDASWTEWSSWKEGNDLSAATLRPGRYAQWRAELSGDGRATPRVTAVEMSFRQENLRPRIDRFAALEPGQVLVPTSFNPADQVFEPLHPSRGGMFTTLRPAEATGDARVKPLWKLGYRTLRWKVEDPNGDPLEYDLAFRPEGGEEWLPLAEKLADDSYSFDAVSLPDGVYRFRLRASDRAGNPGDEPLVVERVTEPVTVDHSPPRRLSVRRDGSRLEVDVEDALSPLRSAEASVDGGEWAPVAAKDGLLDSRRESLRIPVPAKARFVLLRVLDASFNQISFDLSEGSR